MVCKSKNTLNDRKSSPEADSGSVMVTIEAGPADVDPLVSKRNVFRDIGSSDAAYMIRSLTELDKTQADYGTMKFKMVLRFDVFKPPPHLTQTNDFTKTVKHPPSL